MRQESDGRSETKKWLMTGWKDNFNNNINNKRVMEREE